ncbi:Box C/D snoRNA accumulation [Yamadazyma tenuis]|uniref:HIT-type domain-containing protein n=1 Tax=Candida tenuis (strain ATCC 10573 / BCRC 21748 / CBS 615 / JCM 9827 / NBRC 10315 / NRRL Y-1498 / VKM Y-70) TaxID=590646 RepID=G3B148_CANTC|nr:uncharacterized protein CANTEDRAFT_103417 [Yamadazyma tenuis ATCC 10573]EGV64877.1 hypothetical protein CANTEDRAFT_103417 [Yamadazyma tenuis ATCC 10573]WEJ97672.1 Box C/D snoRNA accumulation [Yamadazyma tenuis]
MSDTSALCSICLESSAKYTCPACTARTCSMECIKRHKKQTECTGKVDQSKFIPKKELAASALHINRDYNFLLQMGREISVGKTDVKVNARNVFKRGNNSNYNRNKRPKLEASDAHLTDHRITAVKKHFPENTPYLTRRENTMCVILPDGMSRSTSNKSGYDKKSQTFTWTVQWLFIDAKGVTQKDFLSYRISETATLRDAVPLNVLQSVQENIQKDQLKFYLKNVFAQPKSHHNLYISLDGDAVLANTLKDTVVLEYPTIYVSTEELTVNVVGVEKAYLEDSGSDTESESDSDHSDSDTDSDFSSSSNDSSDQSGSDDEAPEELPINASKPSEPLA